MSEHNVIAIDLGASSGRLMHIRQRNDRMEMREIYRFLNEGIHVSGRTYTDILHIYHEILQGLRIAVREIKTIDGIGIDAWGHDFTVLDSNEELMRNPYQYRDTQSRGMIEKAERIFGKRRLFQLTGMKDFWCNTVYQILGLKERNGSILKEGTNILLIPDFLTFLLTGTKTGEYTSATLTQMYDIAGKSWSREILKQLEIPEKMMPTMLSHGEIKGYLTKAVLEEIGAAAECKIPVINIAEHDSAAAAYAAPADMDQYVFISSGTWSIIGTVMQDPVISDAVYESGFSNEGAAYGKTKMVRTFMGMWFIQELRKFWERKGMNTDYAYLINEARSSAPFARFLDVEDDLFCAPDNMETAINTFFEKTEQTQAASQGEFYRAVMESLAYTYRFSIERLTSLTGFKPETVYLLGGSARDTMFCQFIADATGCKVCAGPIEATAIGNALMQIESFKDSRKDEIKKLRENAEVIYYQPENFSVWDEHYKEFCSVINGRK